MKSCVLSWRSIRKWSISLLVLALTVIMVAVSGCADTDGTTKTYAQTSGVNSLALTIRKIAVGSYIEVLLVPRDEDGILVETEGIVDAKIWYQMYETNGAISKGDLFQEWNIPITKSDYTPFLGAVITLEYNDYNKTLDLSDIYGIIEVTLTLPDGTILNIEKTNLAISESYSC
jgi:hypothetical protein